MPGGPQPASGATAPRWLVDSLQQTSQKLAADLVDKNSQIEVLAAKLRAFEDDHAEEVAACRFQVTEQDKVIKALQAEVQQLQAAAAPRSTSEAACQTGTAPVAHASCQAKPAAVDAGQQTLPAASCCAATQTETEPVQGDGHSAAPAGPGQHSHHHHSHHQHSHHHRHHHASTGTQTEGHSQGPGDPGPAAHAAAPWGADGGPGTPGARSKHDAHQAQQSSSQSLAFDLQVLTSQYQRAIAAKVEAEEALLQAQNDAAQLISLCEFYKAKAEAAAVAQAAMQAAMQAAGVKAARPASQGQVAGTSNGGAH